MTSGTSEVGGAHSALQASRCGQAPRTDVSVGVSAHPLPGPPHTQPCLGLTQHGHTGATRATAQPGPRSSEQLLNRHRRADTAPRSCAQRGLACLQHARVNDKLRAQTSGGNWL